MPLWRCTNPNCSTDAAGRAIFDFEADVPVCPSCETDGRKTLNVIVRLKVIHYDPPHPRIKGRGKGHAACDKNKPVMGTDTVAFTGEPTVVNCPACRATEEWQAVAREREIVPEADFVVGVTEQGVITRG